jgi:DeoR/GlpR family transcriptional regulator of sugar metabolism
MRESLDIEHVVCVSSYPANTVREGMVSRANRRARMLEELERLGSMSVAELVELHGVSEMTVRRDLAQLEEEGLVRRFHGGAVLDRPRSFEPPYNLRQNRRRIDKQRLGAAVAELIGDGDTVALDYGTTVLAVARELRHVQNLTVVTPNLRAALELVDEPAVRVLVTGGVLRPSELALIGRDAERTFERYNVDTAIVSAAGLDVSGGLTDYNPEEVAVKQAMIARATKVIAVVDASKVGVVAFASVIDVGRVDLLFTTASPDDDVVHAIADRGVEVRTIAVDDRLTDEAAGATGSITGAGVDVRVDGHARGGA